MITSALPSNHGVSRELLELRARAEDLQRQMATGQKAESYRDLGAARTASLSLRARLSALEGYRQAIQTAGIRIDAVSAHLTRLAEIGSSTRSDSLVGQFDIVRDGKTPLQLGAAEKLSEAVALLNFQLDGHHYFAGRDGSTRPVRPAAEILNGSGSKAGLKQVISERRQADLGTDGLGRLSVPVPAAEVVDIAEDAAGSPFGFKLGPVTGSLTGTTVAGPTGAPPAIAVTFSATLPQDGETITFALDLPDGSSTSMTLTARSAGPAAPGEFIAAVDENATAASFQAAFAAAVGGLAATELSAASAFAAAGDFFAYDSADPPQRVDGPPFDSATALRDATAADTVFWYEGDNRPGNPRESAVVRVDDALTVAYGVRADEAPITTLVSTLAVLAAESFDPGETDSQDRFLATRDRAAQRLGYLDGGQSIEDVGTEIGYVSKALEDTRERHDRAGNVALDFLAEAEEVDIYEVSARLLQIRNSLEASYQVSALLSQLSLTRFL